MTTPQFLTTETGRKLAYHKTEGRAPGVVFLGGFKSDMDGTKAVHLEAWANRQGRGFLRFDYSGHGQSSEAFTDGSIGDWAEDAAAALSSLTEGRQILVGSSMGGWISLLLARRMPDRIAGLVTIAAAAIKNEKSNSVWGVELLILLCTQSFPSITRLQMLAFGLPKSQLVCWMQQQQESLLLLMILFRRLKELKVTA